jgi:nitrogen-specific signal transduction histidine kinase
LIAPSIPLLSASLKPSRCSAWRRKIDDDGRGLPAAKRAEVFQRGRRLDEGVPGSGLGLAIVQDLVERYGGTIRLGDSPLGGLRAVVELPRAGGSHAQPGASPSQLLADQLTAQTRASD